MDKDYQDILEWIDKSPHSRPTVLIALKLDEAEKEAPTARGKLKTEDFAVIIDRLLRGETAKKLALEFGVSTARISEIKREKSIPMNALKSYLEAKAKALKDTE